jgi:hypothetical protein
VLVSADFTADRGLGPAISGHDNWHGEEGRVKTLLWIVKGDPPIPGGHRAVRQRGAYEDPDPGDRKRSHCCASLLGTGGAPPDTIPV